jgi:hypothetical protein
MVTPMRPARPGLAKVRTPPVLLRRSAEMIATQGGRLLELLDAASVVSEGAAREEAAARGGEGERVYYGSSSLLFAHQSAGGILPDAQGPDLVFALEHDPHARLQVVRVAHREALSRAGSKIGPVSAELRVKLTARGVLVTIDVSARFVRERASGALF